MAIHPPSSLFPLPLLLPHSPTSLARRQEVPATPGQPTKQPVLIPLAVGLVGSNGSDLPLTDVFDGESMVSLRGPDGGPVTTAVLRFNKVSGPGTVTFKAPSYLAVLSDQGVFTNTAPPSLQQSVLRTLYSSALPSAT